MNKVLKQKSLLYGLIAVLIVLLVIGAMFFTRSRFNVFPQMISSVSSQNNTIVTFPEIDDTKLTDSQKKVISVLKAEYQQQPAGTKYSEGVNEAWCADFVSWVYNEAGVPLSNPNSGYWRIPGTFTLREYYEQEGRFKQAGTNYVPKVGDIMLYDNPSPFGQHTNIVIESNDGVITTIGGNEPGGIRIVKHTTKDDAGFLGYGQFI